MRSRFDGCAIKRPGLCDALWDNVRTASALYKHPEASKTASDSQSSRKSPVVASSRPAYRLCHRHIFLEGQENKQVGRLAAVSVIQ